MSGRFLLPELPRPRREPATCTPGSASPGGRGLGACASTRPLNAFRFTLKSRETDAWKIAFPKPSRVVGAPGRSELQGRLVGGASGKRTPTPARRPPGASDPRPVLGPRLRTCQSAAPSLLGSGDTHAPAPARTLPADHPQGCALSLRLEPPPQVAGAPKGTAKPTSSPRRPPSLPSPRGPLPGLRARAGVTSRSWAPHLGPVWSRPVGAQNLPRVQTSRHALRAEWAPPPPSGPPWGPAPSLGSRPSLPPWGPAPSLPPWGPARLPPRGPVQPRPCSCLSPSHLLSPPLAGPSASPCPLARPLPTGHLLGSCESPLACHLRRRPPAHPPTRTSPSLLSYTSRHCHPSPVTCHTTGFSC